MTDDKKLDAIIQFYEKKMQDDYFCKQVLAAMDKLIRSALTWGHDFTKLPIAGIYDNIVCGNIKTATLITLDLVQRGDFTPAQHAAKVLCLLMDKYTPAPVGVPEENQYGDDSLFWKHAKVDTVNDRRATLNRKIRLGQLIMYTTIDKDWTDYGSTIDGLYNYIINEQR